MCNIVRTRMNAALFYHLIVLFFYHYFNFIMDKSRRYI